jgi:branched-chain amino acid aminotransferase
VSPGTRPAPPVERLVYHGGQLVPAAGAVLRMGSIALRYGVSVFEGIRVYRGAGDDATMRPWLLEPHLDRLRASCDTMGLDAGLADMVGTTIDDLIEVNQLAEDCYVRVSVSAANPGDIGDEAESLLTVSVTPSGRKKWLATGQGMRVRLSSWQRPSGAVFPSATKNISAYAGPRLALTQARRDGFDTCLLRTADGLVSEGPTATVFLVEGTTLVTPRLADDVLPGVTRAWVLAVAARLGLRVEVAAVSPSRLYGADEVFLCGTGLEFGPVSHVDDVAMPSWPALPVTTALVDAYFDEVRGLRAATNVPWPSVDPDSSAAPDPSGG